MYHWALSLLGAVAVMTTLLNAHVSNTYERHAGKASNCHSLIERKEWRTLTHSERAEWVAAVKCLAGIRHERLSLGKNHTMLEGKRSLYDDFSYSHALVEKSAHRNAYFLPWHRWFTHLFDTSLRQTCGYRGPTPYWDWTRDHANLFVSPVFDDSSEHGLGGTGDCHSSATADCIVTTGAFATSDANSFELAWPIPHALRRNLTLITGWFAHERPQNRTLTPEHVRHAIEQTTGDFSGFQAAMALLHNHVHNFVGGDLAGDCPRALPERDCGGMAIDFTPNDPIFWLHHAQLDRLWSEWQRNHPSNFAAFSDTPDHNMSFDVQSAPVAPKDVFDTEAWPLCYRYAEEA